VQWSKGDRALETDEGEWRDGRQFGKGTQSWSTGRLGCGWRSRKTFCGPRDVAFGSESVGSRVLAGCPTYPTATEIAICAQNITRSLSMLSRVNGDWSFLSHPHEHGRRAAGRKKHDLWAIICCS
jgi:hypothetical protein